MKIKAPIVPCLWFDGQAKEAAEFYISIFEGSKITNISYYPAGDAETRDQEPGAALTVSFELSGQKFIGLNGGPHFKFNEAVSFYIMCKNQEEIDYFWDALTADGGTESQCGWLKDKYGVSWQIVPANIEELICGEGPRAARVLNKVYDMKKLDIATMENA